MLKAIINNSYGIPLTIRIQNPSSTDKGPESSTWNLEYTAWILESKTLGFPYIGRGFFNC